MVWPLGSRTRPSPSRTIGAEKWTSLIEPVCVQVPSAYSNVATGFGGVVPAGVVTVTVILPRPRAGLTALIRVADSTVKLAAGVPPNLTAVAPVKPVPSIVTFVPPVTGPLRERSEVTSGEVGASATLATKTSEPPAGCAWKAPGVVGKLPGGAA